MTCAEVKALMLAPDSRIREASMAELSAAERHLSGCQVCTDLAHQIIEYFDSRLPKEESERVTREAEEMRANLEVARTYDSEL